MPIKGYSKQFLESSLEQLQNQHQKLINHPPLKGTGFVPCDHCISINPETLKTIINTNRTFAYPFPFKGSVLITAEKEFEKFQQNYQYTQPLNNSGYFGPNV